jgi:zinc transporter ZupT
MVNMTLLYVGIFALISTLLGGYAAFRYKKYIHIFGGLTAGTLLAIVFVEIIPEITKLSPSHLVLIPVVAGFIAFHILEKIFSLHGDHSLEHKQSDHKDHNHVSKKIATWALILHSLFDGVAIGLAYHISPEFGIIIAIGVIAHDFSDGFNAVSLSHSRKLLLLDAVAPIFGIILGTYFIFSNNVMSILFGIFGGALLYVSTSDILPEAHCDNRKHMVQNLVAMICGVIYIVIVTSLN